MAKRTGLGRGIGALIPTTESAEARPVDVFFPGAPARAERAATAGETASARQGDAQPVDAASPASTDHELVA
ncbi:MAG TPA: chromosome partitioning protein ParB, partial [Microbacterium sp.]|nr:chromosome partitioning protein ParB [Microbacterium sp.]